MPLPVECAYIYDKEKWRQNFDPKKESDLNEETVNGYILARIQYTKEYIDYNMWCYFKEDFFR